MTDDRQRRRRRQDDWTDSNYEHRKLNEHIKNEPEHLNEYIQNEESEILERRRSLRHKKQKRRVSIFTLKRTLVTFGTVFVLALVAYTVILYGGKLITDEEKLIITPPTTIESEDGSIIWYLYDQYRLPVSLEQIPEHVQQAFIAIEDQRFYEHAGVDVRSVLRALYRDILARKKVEGASTITQQLAKNLFLTNEKTWLRKTKEAMIALYLEREFSKDDIFEMYLNVVYFGQGQYGIEAAANRYFYKSVEELTLEEGALLAGILKAPNGYSPIEHPKKAKERRDLVLSQMAKQGYITEEEAERAQAKEIELNLSQRKINPAYHTVVDMAIKEAEEKYGITLEELKQKRFRIITTVDEKAQEIAFEQFQHDGYFPGNDKSTVEGAFVMMDEKTGGIVAALGGRRFETFHLNRVYAKRQPGSTMKPIAVYAPALETEKYSPYSLLKDELKEWDGRLIRNHDNHYEGEVTLYDALVKSKNTSAVWLLNEIGVNAAKSYLEKMNIDIPDNDLGIALGGLEHGLSPLELVESYRTFIHQGEMIESHIIKEIYDHKGAQIATAKPETVDVFTPQVAWNMVEMLKSVVTNGTGQAGYYPHELAGKTGTTQHVHVEGEVNDAWFVGFTPEYVMALWMGYDESTEEQYLTGGSSYPTELTKKILTELDKQKALATTFVKPDNVHALEEPIDLPKIVDLESSYVFGGIRLLKGKLSWTATNDDRVVYRIYEETEDGPEKVGEVYGTSEFIIDEFSIFKTKRYFVVPYDPIANLEGEPSNVVQLTF